LKKEVLVLEERLKQQAATMPGKIEDAKTLARLLARRDWEQEMEQRIAEDRAMVRKACEEFERERTRYFAAVEGQVVKLSLAIAARVLYREAKMDPLLLSAAVRVALEKVEDQSETRLKVPISEVALWKEVFETGKADSVKVLGEECMTRGECVLETSVGTVELGIEGAARRDRTRVLRPDEETASVMEANPSAARDVQSATVVAMRDTRMEAYFRHLEARPAWRWRGKRGGGECADGRVSGTAVLGGRKLRNPRRRRTAAWRRGDRLPWSGMYW
jgi:hypothetical protein